MANSKTLSLKRIIRNGIINFWRNGLVSFATILVMVLTLFMVGSLLFFNVMLNSALLTLEDKVDISVYFKTGAEVGEIASLQSSLIKLPQVKKIEYISSEQALADFKIRHANNTLITRSLEEIGENPLGASLNIKATDPSQYESITKFLGANAFSVIIDKVNYYQNKIVIERLSDILTASRNVGVGASLVLAMIAILVAFNTIRLAIYTNREEITVMRLVGATNKYIRGPYIVEGALHGVLATVITMTMFYPLTYWLGPQAERFFGGPNLFSYYMTNFFQIFVLLMLVGIVLGTFSSWIAVRRYLKA